MLKKFKENNKKISMPLIIFWLCSALALTVYWAVTYGGLFRIYNEFQIHYFGDYVELVTFLFVFATLCIALIPVVIFFALILFVLGVPGVNSQERKLNGIRSLKVLVKEIQYGIRTSFFFAAGSIFSGICIIVLCFGIYSSILLINTGGIKTVPVKNVNSGMKGKEVILTGKTINLLNEAWITQQISGRSESIIYYYLIRDNGEINNDNDPKVFFELSSYKKDKRESSEELKGILHENSLPGVIRDLYEKEKILLPGEKYLVLVYGENTERIKEDELECYIGALITGFIGAVMFLLYRRYDRKKILSLIENLKA
jgi:hypothetical protein